MEVEVMALLFCGNILSLFSCWQVTKMTTCFKMHILAIFLLKRWKTLQLINLQYTLQSINFGWVTPPVNLCKKLTFQVWNLHVCLPNFDLEESWGQLIQKIKWQGLYQGRFVLYMKIMESISWEKKKDVQKMGMRE